MSGCLKWLQLPRPLICCPRPDVQGPEGEPVWRQIARDYLNHSLLAVAMRAQMALGESDSPRDTAGDQHFRS